IIILVAGPIALNNIGWKFFLVMACPTAVYIPVIYLAGAREDNLVGSTVVQAEMPG
ncbi:hypothetical protein LTR53_010042, partial [Teratosphaeriaceae sp. CCFEE 6253]